MIATGDWQPVTDMVRLTDIPFSRIPHQSQLFLSYLEASPAALRFYQSAPSVEGIADARARIGNMPFPRREIASILRRQNEKFGSGALTLKRIGELERPDCVAILTGQQVGLFTGPLYTVYKALTAVRMADDLNQQGISAVPVFWMDTEDHDLPEVTRRALLYPDSSLRSIDYREALFDEMPAFSVGSIPFPDKILLAVQHYLAHLPDGAAKADIATHLESACRPGVTFAESFGELLARLLPDWGLILFDPRDPDAKRLVSSVFQKALSEEAVFRNALLRRNHELESSGFHAQVNVLGNSTVLFYLDQGERRAIERRGSGFGLKNTDHTFGLDELRQEAGRTPEKFSPNVLLRPVVQDHLFPTIAYVGGSSELAYFAQAGVLYELYGRPMPVAWPRNSFTLLEPEVAAEMDRLRIEFPDCFQGRHLLAEWATRHSRSRAASEIDELGGHIDRVLMGVRPELEAVEATLADALETARRKIQHNVQRLRSRAIRFEVTGDSAISTAVDFVLNNCYPNQNLQERELGIYHFLARRGVSVLDDLRSVMNPGHFVHGVIRL